MSFRKLIEVAFDQNGAESAETHNLRACLNRAGRRRSNAGDVFEHVGGFQTVGGNEGVDVEAAGFCIHARTDLNMADGPGRNPR